MSKPVNPYAAPVVTPNTHLAGGQKLGGGAPGEGIWRWGGALIVDKYATFPDICVKTNEPTDGWKLKRSLSWHHPAIFLAILAGVLIYVILALVLRKTALLHVGLSQAKRNSRRVLIILAWVIALGGMALCPIGISMQDPGQPDAQPYAPFLVIAGILVPIVAAIVGLIGARVVWPAKITDRFVVLNGCHRDFISRFPDWPYPPL